MTCRDRGVTATEPVNFEDLSPARQVQCLLDDHGDAKWGWVIYRCTYKPELEERWAEFKRLVNEQIRDQIDGSDAPEVADALDWPIVEDPALEGAPLEVLKSRWRQWVLEEKPDVDTEDFAMDRSSRYTYFIRVDEDCLRSMLHDYHDPANPNNRMALRGGWVGIVKGWKDPLPPEEATYEDGEVVDNEDWMHMHASMVAPYFYAELDHPESWYCHYSEPPNGLCIW
ncbi:hypothetical protein BJ166DRAFT_592522 [Pestalotiopsis sp. NC0098]|nr:hypothetical protein BJ166DRAFT_592522 [Pestalotiopsis sp. NC0098]